MSPIPALTGRRPLLIGSRRGLQSGLSLIALSSWTFPSRVQSECLPPASQQAGEHLLSDERLSRRAAIGLEEGKLVTKVNRRKHMANGAALAKSCPRGASPEEFVELHAPLLSCPVRSLWPAIKTRTEMGAGRESLRSYVH